MLIGYFTALIFVSTPSFAQSSFVLDAKIVKPIRNNRLKNNNGFSDFSVKSAIPSNGIRVKATDSIKHFSSIGISPVDTSTDKEKDNAKEKSKNGTESNIYWLIIYFQFLLGSLFMYFVAMRFADNDDEVK